MIQASVFHPETLDPTLRLCRRAAVAQGRPLAARVPSNNMASVLIALIAGQSTPLLLSGKAADGCLPVHRAVPTMYPQYRD